MKEKEIGIKRREGYSPAVKLTKCMKNSRSFGTHPVYSWV